MDSISKLGISLIQHGRQNDRIYLMKLDLRDMPDILGKLDEMAQDKGYSKIFAKVPSNAADVFKTSGYREEATIPRFYNGKMGVVFFGKYFSNERLTMSNAAEIQKIINLANEKSGQGVPTESLPRRFKIRKATPDDAAGMADIYKEVFATYPFPIHNPHYLRETMKSHIDYFCVLEDGKMVALASAEMDMEGRNVEMTDFATLPSHRGNSLAVRLLARMESEMQQRGMHTAFTIARAISAGMNITFSKLGYKFTGTLVNNTNISGNIESMNVWYKELS